MFGGKIGKNMVASVYICVFHLGVLQWPPQVYLYYKYYTIYLQDLLQSVAFFIRNCWAIIGQLLVTYILTDGCIICIRIVNNYIVSY